MKYIFLRHDQHHDIDNNPGEYMETMEAGDAKEISAKGEECRPYQPAKNIVTDEMPVGHFTNTGNERRKSTDDGDETRQKNGDDAVFLVKGMRFFQVFPLEQLWIAGESFRANILADMVIYSVP